MMKRIPVILVFLMIVLSCGPSRHAVHVEMRYPSKSGIDMAGKTISVVYLESDDSVNNHLLGGIADGFAYSLEREYETGEGSVGVYRVTYSPGTVYSQKDSLISLILDTDSDIVFFLDTLKTDNLTMGGATRVASSSAADSSYISTGRMPFTVRMYGYDSMDMKDKVYTFSGSSIAAPHAYSDGLASDSVIMERALSSLPQVGFEAGKALSTTFHPQWKHEQYSIVYFDNQQWYKALAYADQYFWKEAMDIWIGLLDTSDVLKRSCAEYNIAVACYMLGDCHLASEWLDRSDVDTQLPVSESLRKRISARL